MSNKICVWVRCIFEMCRFKSSCAFTYMVGSHKNHLCKVMSKLNTIHGSNFPCVILFLCFSVLLLLRLPLLGKRELILVLFVRLFDLCLFGFVGFLFLLGSGKGCGLWLWHSVDFSHTLFYYYRNNLIPLFIISVCLFVLRFYGPVNPVGSCRARSVYLTTRLLGRLSPLSG